MDQQIETPELRSFLEALNPGEALTGTVAAIERFGVFVAPDDIVAVGEGLLGLVPFRGVHGCPAGRPEDFRTGEEVSVVVTHIERPTRRILLSGS
ncbi:S1 RNA-binding domain-containing protein [Streptomyces sp. NPDC088757]|uniref:S1 RNA-binding domain-containing protein n=1 Tax=Streptomyces sp. NPDC088757 TaxID=3365889 RepID=UPI003804E240